MRSAGWAQLVATAHPTQADTRLGIGLDRLQRADLPTAAEAPADPAPVPDEAPIHLLRRRVHQTVSGGRSVLALPGDTPADARRLHHAGLASSTS